jgi:DNA-binding protein H-NS
VGVFINAGRLNWTGRGMTPVWMREEMKGAKLTKDDFLIK